MIGGLEENKLMKARKDSLGISDWFKFMSLEKLKMREKYVDCFMKGIPELKNTLFLINISII